MIINAAAIQKLREDAAGNEGAAVASFAGIQNGRECRQNEIFAENGVRFYPLLPGAPLVAYARDFLHGPKTSMRAYLLAKKHLKNRVEIAWLVPFMPFLKFAQMYIWRHGYRDGSHGFWLAVLSAVYVVLRYAKYWALQRRPAPGNGLSK